MQTEENNPDPSKSKRKSSVVATPPIGNRKAGSPARSPSAWTTEAATQTLPMEVPPESWQRIATLETRVKQLSTKTSRDFASVGVCLDRLELQSTGGAPLENICSEAFRKKARPGEKEVRQRLEHRDADKKN